MSMCNTHSHSTVGYLKRLAYFNVMYMKTIKHPKTFKCQAFKFFFKLENHIKKEVVFDQMFFFIFVFLNMYHLRPFAVKCRYTSFTLQFQYFSMQGYSLHSPLKKSPTNNKIEFYLTVTFNLQFSQISSHGPEMPIEGCLIICQMATWKPLIEIDDKKRTFFSLRLIFFLFIAGIF